VTFSESTKAKFKDLNLDKLKYLANKTWVEQSKEKFGFPSDSIEKTILYKIKSIEKGQLHNEISDEQWEKHKEGLRKYAIIFYTDRTYSTNDVETGQQVMDIVQGKSQINTDPELSRLMRATGQNSCFPPKNRRFFQKEDFDEIYKKKCLPDGPPWDEWLFLAHAEGIRIPGYVKIERNDVTLYKNPNYGSSVQERIGFFYDDYLPGKGLITESLTDKWEKLIPRWAITNGYIEAKKLTCLLAKDEDYIPLLPGLWEDFQMGISGDPCPHPGGFDSRIDAWAGLLYRWVNDEAFGLKVQELKKIEIVGDGEDIKIPLKEIKRYFIELSQVPLPESLFPDGSQEGGINLYDSLSLPAQEIKEGPAPESKQANDSSQKHQSQIEICTPSGTTWEQIRFRYVNDDRVEISHPGVETHAPCSMADLGLDSKRALSTLLNVFAEHRGSINSENMGIKAVKANISNLRKHLKKIFPEVEGQPIAKYSQREGYRCNFTIFKAN